MTLSSAAAPKLSNTEHGNSDDEQEGFDVVSLAPKRRPARATATNCKSAPNMLKDADLAGSCSDQADGQEGEAGLDNDCLTAIANGGSSQKDPMNEGCTSEDEHGRLKRQNAMKKQKKALAVVARSTSKRLETPKTPRMATAANDDRKSAEANESGGKKGTRTSGRQAEVRGAAVCTQSKRVQPM